MIGLEVAVAGMLDAEEKLTHDIHSPVVISENMYRLGQYTSIVEKHLGLIEEKLELEWAEIYDRFVRGVEFPDGTFNDKPMSATAAKQMADRATAREKGQIAKLKRFVSSSWKIHTGAMARINHLQQEMRGAV